MFVCTWGNFVANYYQDIESSGYRQSYLKRPEKRPLIEGKVLGTLVSWWIYRLNYNLALGFVKLSILFFYRTIATNRIFRRLVYVVMALVIMYTLGAVIAAIFQCQTPSDGWSPANYFATFDKFDPKRRQPKCYDPVKLWAFTAAANLTSDLIILLLPLPALLSLRIPLSKRLALIGVFSVGLLAIVASSVRVWVMSLWAVSPSNSARYGNDLLLWGQVETNSGIISASIPFLRLLFRDREIEEKGTIQKTPKKITTPTPTPAELEAQSQPEVHGEDQGSHQSEKPAQKPAGQIGLHWGPFITVPQELNPRTGGNPQLEPVHELEPAHEPRMNV
ncbi:integral membrane [Pyrenophora seminiperda CCB06]|uniref:Integral membrane n=1 Tax=Pyrenophora seminiperda CCB06 TaxID=1302712 RepID=A0A3M7MGG1_9PLEO|nr:integral membrane [Pyrenophora seminiperda CCB06]